MEERDILERIETLPVNLRREILDFAEFLISRSAAQKTPRKLSLDWAGGLKGMKEKYTSVQLQHKASEWR